MFQIISILLFQWAQAQDPTKTPTCLSSECDTLSKRYRSHIKISVDPCEDFYEYACGNYPNKHPIPEHARKMSAPVEMQEFIDKHFIELLENTKYGNISRSLHLAKIYYDSCVNEESRERFGKDPLIHLVKSLGGWELLYGSVFNETTFQWEELLGKLLQHGVYYIFNPYVNPSINNTDQHILMLDPPRTFLRSSKETHLQLYRRYILSILEKLGAKMRKDVEERVDALIKFEKNLYKIARSQYDPVILTFGDIKTRFNNIKWDLIFDQEIKNALGGVNDSTVIHINVPGYFEKLNELITSTPKQEIYDYLFWRLVADYIPYLPENYQEPLKEFNTENYGASGRPPVREQCAIETRDKFDLPLAAEFIYTYFNISAKSEVLNMIQNIKNAMKFELENADWLDEKTRKEALKKLEKMGSKLIHPDYIFDLEYIGRRYDNVHLSQDHYFENVIKLRKREQRYNLLKMNRKVGEDWYSRVLEIGAGYDEFLNLFELPASMLSFPFFSTNVPSFLNYGAVGSIIAHEITHGFDTRGKDHDETGNYRNWWDNATEIEFENRAKCFIDQYNEEIEPITKMHPNGAATQQENVADNGGLRIAYQAFRSALEQREDHRGLPRFQDFTSDKLFFIAYANNYCITPKKASIPHLMNAGGHAFQRFRVNVPFRNLPEFSKAFNCQKGKMLMENGKACRVW